MTAPTFTTRSEADPRRQLVEVMAPAFWDAEKPQGSTLPEFAKIEPTYQEAVRRGLAGALAAAERAGWAITKGDAE